ncbi:MICOS complex subunit Mic10 [Ixodes scapularis]|uniref:MICOS complex subunit Mic10 n=1 Tax=Ixodes scapularis TaxID=6945 RepID=UPI001A9D6197|nr:MICOS complex subunit Mic10 [Ixodes scapularis]
MATRSEDVLGEKWDKCIADTLIKMGAGLGVGVVFSVVLFKRRAWPVVFGLGSGFGMGYNHCQHMFNESALLRAYTLKAKQKETATPTPAAPAHK